MTHTSTGADTSEEKQNKKESTGERIAQKIKRRSPDSNSRPLQITANANQVPQFLTPGSNPEAAGLHLYTSCTSSRDPP